MENTRLRDKRLELKMSIEEICFEVWSRLPASYRPAWGTIRRAELEPDKNPIVALILCDVLSEDPSKILAAEDVDEARRYALAVGGAARRTVHSARITGRQVPPTRCLRDYVVSYRPFGTLAAESSENKNLLFLLTRGGGGVNSAQSYEL